MGSSGIILRSSNGERNMEVCPGPGEEQAGKQAMKQVLGIRDEKTRMKVTPPSLRRWCWWYIRIYLILVGCCGCMLDVVICGVQSAVHCIQVQAASDASCY